MTVSIPKILLRRINNLLGRCQRDGVLKAALSTIRVDGLKKKLGEVADKYPPNYFRDEIEKGAFTKGLQYAAQDAASRSWLTTCPKGRTRVG